MPKINFRKCSKTLDIFKIAQKSKRIVFFTVTFTIWVIQMMILEKPILENKVYGPGGGIPLLKSLWGKFDLSLLFLQTGFQKHSGISAWLMAFAYICGLIAQRTSVNQNAEFSSDSPVLGFLLKGKTISQSAFSRFFSKPYQWLKLSLARVSSLQEHQETALSDGDIIALDDTKVAHPFGKKLPFLCWLFDYSDKTHVQNEGDQNEGDSSSFFANEMRWK